MQGIKERRNTAFGLVLWPEGRTEEQMSAPNALQAARRAPQPSCMQCHFTLGMWGLGSSCAVLGTGHAWE